MDISDSDSDNIIISIPSKNSVCYCHLLTFDINCFRDSHERKDSTCDIFIAPSLFRLQHAVNESQNATSYNNKNKHNFSVINRPNTHWVYLGFIGFQS